MFTISCGEYEVSCQAVGLPGMLDEYERRAKLAERVGMDSAGAECFCAVRRRGDDWPNLVVSQKYAPGVESGFSPGLALVPETHRLFLGAGCRLRVSDAELKPEDRSVNRDGVLDNGRNELGTAEDVDLVNRLRDIS